CSGYAGPDEPGTAAATGTQRVVLSRSRRAVGRQVPQRLCPVRAWDLGTNVGQTDGVVAGGGPWPRFCPPAEYGGLTRLLSHPQRHRTTPCTPPPPASAPRPL